jgi:hypothetical protein
MSSNKENDDERFPLTLSNKHHFVSFQGLEEKLQQSHKDKELRAHLRNAFTDPPADLFHVRGPNYLKDGHGGKNLTHLKVPSREPPYELIGVNMFRTGSRMVKVAEEVGELRRFFHSQPEDEPGALFPTFLLVNWMMSPLFGWGKNHIVQHIFKLKRDTESDPAIEAAFARFKAGSLRDRNHQLKYMFRIVDAPSAVKSAISYLGGERPVLIGKALATHYEFGRNYLEISSDVSSSKIASAINGTILRNVETLVMDCSWLLEGQREEELPERLLCKIRWIWNCVEDVIVLLDESGERVSD